MKKMIRKIAFCLIMVCCYQFSSAQKDFNFSSKQSEESNTTNFILGISGGVGKYLQTDLNEINRNVRQNLSFDTQFTDDFPATAYYGMYFLFRLGRNLTIGPDYRFHTTGSRLAYKDYSGSYTFDQVLSSHSIAIRMEFMPACSRNLQAGLTTLLGTGLASWKINEKLILGEEETSSSARFDASRIFVCPGLKVRYNINSFISVSPFIGYSFDLTGKYYYHHNKDVKTDMVAGWSGARAEINIELAL